MPMFPTWRCFILPSLRWGSAPEGLLAPECIGLIRVQLQSLRVRLAGPPLVSGVVVSLTQPHPRLYVLVVDRRRPGQLPDRVGVVFLQEVVEPQLPQGDPCVLAGAGRV